MNANAELWCQTLEKNEIPQCKEQLADGDARCCLGVACDLFIQAHPTLLELDGNTYYGESADDATLPAEVLRWLGLSDDCGDFGGDCSLAEMNDKGATFPEIAAIIRSEPAGLFKEVKP